MTDSKKTEEKKINLKPAFALKGHEDDVSFILEHGKVDNDTITLSQGDTEKFFETHGVGRDDLEKIKKATDRLDTASVVAANSVLKHNISEAVKKGEDPSKLRSRFRGRTSVFNHEATVTASKEVPAGAMKPGEKPERKTIYGHFSVGMKVRGNVDETLKSKVADTTRKALGV